GAYGQMQQFFARKRLTAIGSSDSHGNLPIGFCRTYVFVEDASEAGILDALRAGRTAVYDRDGRAWGDAEFIKLAATALPRPEGPPAANWRTRFSCLAGFMALSGLIACGAGPRPAAAS